MPSSRPRQGVITQKTLARTSAGASNFGFFLQNTAATADSDPNSSDGIFVFLFTSQTVTRDPAGTPQVGDKIRIRGRVSEFFSLTQISASIRLEAVIRSGVDLASEVPAFETLPPDDLAGAGRYWERREGMRARIPSGAIVTGRPDVFSSTADGELWLIRGDHALVLASGCACTAIVP